MEQLHQNCTDTLNKLPKHVRLIAASKTRTIAEIQAAYQAGVHNFGENYVQEGVEKAQQLPEATWHFIGKLQRNKVNMALKGFTVFHTVDSLKLLDKINTSAARENLRPHIYIQVNVAGEDQKAGCSVADLPSLIEAAQHMTHIELVGLMTLPPADEDPTPYFQKLKALATAHNLPRLSMGMSGDWEKAIDCGATDIRLGTTLFGPRLPKSK